MAVCRLAHTKHFRITILVGWRTQATLLPLQPAYWKVVVKQAPFPLVNPDSSALGVQHRTSQPSLGIHASLPKSHIITAK